MLCRSARKDEKQRDEQRMQLGLPEHVKLLQESAADGEAAAMVHFGNGSGFANSRCSFNTSAATWMPGCLPPPCLFSPAARHLLSGLWYCNRKHKREAIRSESIFSPEATAAAVKRRARTGTCGSLSVPKVGGVQKRKSTLDKAELLAKRRRMDAGLKLGLSVPG